MITKPTIFILGAGSSIPYNYPSGKGLVDKIISDLLKKQLLYKLCLKLEFGEAEINRFANALQFSGDYSIDAFLERNSEFMALGKTVITLILIEKEHTATLFSPGEDKWYGDLINELKSPAINDFNNEVSFLTFNYDRSFDHYLFVAIQNSYGISDKECADIVNNIPIIHIHGQIGELPWKASDGRGRQYDNNLREYRTIIDILNRHRQISALELSSAVHYIRKISNQIKIIHEADIENDPEFKKAHTLLEKAKNIYFLGFGYNDENLSRLKINDLSPSIFINTSKGKINMPRNIQGTAYGIGEAKRRHINTITNSKVMLSDRKYKVLEFLKERVDFN